MPYASTIASFFRRLLGAVAVCALAAAAAILGSPASANAQDLYDTTILRTINLQFHDANWWQRLQQNYASETNILADLEMEGVTYPNVGVRIRGNTSYTALPPGSQKVSLNVEMDFVEEDQNLLGYSSLNLNNGFHDPTFCREVVYNNFVATFMPNARANHVLLTLNGQNWGVYINVQQYNKRLLRDYFDDEDGLRIKCANNPNGPGLQYFGSNPAAYGGYEIKNDGGLANPIGALIAVCQAVGTHPLSDWQAIDGLFAIDPSIWSVVLENLLTDDDSYINKGADFMLYRDPADGRTHLHQTDANETFTQANWSITRNFTASNKPMLSRILSVPELRRRYMAHYREAASYLDWAGYFEEKFAAARELIDAAVQADPKKLYTYQQFVTNFTSTVTLPGGFPFGGPVIGLQQFVTQRRNFLNANAELNAQGPVIEWVQPSRESPNPGEDVWFTAAVSESGASVAQVELFYRTSPGSYQRVTMLDNGRSGDGAAGDGVYGALLPVTTTGGQAIHYYVGAASNNVHLSASFFPVLTENGPLQLQVGAGDSGIRITEWMYQGADGEFIELTNLSDKPIDLAGWSLDDDSATPGTFSLSPAGIIAPGQSILITDVNPTLFAAAWELVDVIVLGPNGAAFGRNDEINIFDAEGALADRLTYGDQDFPGTIRTQTRSGNTCDAFLGQNDVYAWYLAVDGDMHGSYVSAGGDIGSPGSFVSVPCDKPCPADFTGDGFVDGADLGILLGAWGGDGLGDLNGDGVVNGADLGILLGAWGACR